MPRHHDRWREIAVAMGRLSVPQRCAAGLDRRMRWSIVDWRRKSRRVFD
jgi:hypothetical protein